MGNNTTTVATGLVGTPAPWAPTGHSVTLPFLQLGHGVGRGQRRVGTFPEFVLVGCAKRDGLEPFSRPGKAAKHYSAREKVARVDLGKGTDIRDYQPERLETPAIPREGSPCLAGCGNQDKGWGY